MPHFVIEYSPNLDGVVDFRKLSHAVHETIVATALFELGAIRVRAFRADACAIADLVNENGFIDMSFRVGNGRTAADLKRAGDLIFTAVSRHLASLFETPHFALSLEIREIDPDLSWKKNVIHPRLRKTSGKAFSQN